MHLPHAVGYKHDNPKWCPFSVLVLGALMYALAITLLPGNGRPAVTSVFLVIEQQPPYGCSLIGLGPAMMDLAERKVARAIAVWAQCVRLNSWPAYPPRIAYASPKPWQLAEAEEKEVDETFDALQAEHGLQI